MSGQAAMTPEALAAAAEASLGNPPDRANREAGFTALRVAALLSERLQDDAARVAGMEDALAAFPAGALDAVAEAALPGEEAVRAAVLAIRAAAADPALRPELLAAMAAQAASRQMLGTAVLTIGVAVSLLLLIAKTEVERSADGKWAFHVHAIDNAALVELAKFGTALLGKLPG